MLLSPDKVDRCTSYSQARSRDVLAVTPQACSQLGVSRHPLRTQLPTPSYHRSEQGLPRHPTHCQLQAPGGHPIASPRVSQLWLGSQREKQKQCGAEGHKGVGPLECCEEKAAVAPTH